MASLIISRAFTIHSKVGLVDVAFCRRITIVRLDVTPSGLVTMWLGRMSGDGRRDDARRKPPARKPLMGRDRIVEPTGDQDVIMNLRVVDPAAFDSLAARLQALIDRATVAAISAKDATERAAQASAGVAAATAMLEERLKLGSRLLRALQHAPPPIASLGDPSAAPSGVDSPAASPSSGASADAAAAQVHAVRRQVQELAEQCRIAQFARAEAEKTVRIRSEILAGVADELADPLATLTRFVTELGDESSQRERQRTLESARQCIDEVSALLRSVVDLTQAEPSAELLDDGVFDLRQTIQLAADAAARRAEERNINLAFVLAQDMPVLARGEAGRLRQAMLYIANTVIKNASEGEVSLAARLDHRTDQYAMIRCDIGCSGANVSQAQIDAVNSAIAGADLDAEPQPDRAGLGLAVARRLVELMHGEIGIEAEAGRCLRVWFTARLDLPQAGSDERRSSARFLQESLMSSLGQVLDLSIEGMRVRSSRALEGVHDIELKDAEQPLTLKATVAWCRRMGFRKYQVGLHFLELTPELRQSLTQLATRNSYRFALPHGELGK